VKEACLRTAHEEGFKALSAYLADFLEEQCADDLENPKNKAHDASIQEPVTSPPMSQPPRRGHVQRMPEAMEEPDLNDA
jgi:hypothetical protein